MRHIGIALLFLLSSGFAQADELKEFSVKIRDYPAKGDCHKVAKEIGQNFEAEGATLVESVCTNITSETFEFEIIYEAEAPVPKISTWTYHPSFRQGGWADQASCEQALPGQVKLFEDATELQAYVSFCQFEEFSRNLPWGPHIEALGVPEKRPYMRGEYIWDRPLDFEPESFLADFEANMRFMGLDDIGFVKYEGFVGNLVISSLVYSAEYLQFSSLEAAQFLEEDHCRAQVKEANLVFRTQTKRPLALYCAPGLRSRFIINVMFSEEYVRTRTSAESFDSYETCMDQRTPLLDRYRTRSSRPLNGGICTLTDDLKSWKVLMVYERG